MLSGQVERGHFGIGLPNVFMGLDQIRFQIDSLLASAYRPIKLTLLAVAESQITVILCIAVISIDRFFVLTGGFALLALLLMGRVLLEMDVGLLTFVIRGVGF